MRKWREKMAGEWENGDAMARKRRHGEGGNLCLSISPPLCISVFSLHFLSPFPRSLAISSSFCHFASRKLRQPALYSLVALIPLYQSSGTWDTEWRKKLGTAFGVLKFWVKLGTKFKIFPFTNVMRGHFLTKKLHYRFAYVLVHSQSYISPRKPNHTETFC